MVEHATKFFPVGKKGFFEGSTTTTVLLLSLVDFILISFLRLSQSFSSFPWRASYPLFCVTQSCDSASLIFLTTLSWVRMSNSLISGAPLTPVLFIIWVKTTLGNGRPYRQNCCVKIFSNTSVCLSFWHIDRVATVVSGDAGIMARMTLMTPKN